MINRTIDMIFEPSGQPIPTRDEVLFEAREIVQRSGWGVPLLERLRHVSNPYWREALTRTLMERWREMVRDKDEQTYYYDMDGYMCYCWADAEYDFNRIIRNSTNEQVEEENNEEKTITQTPPKNITPMQNNYQQINIGTQNNNCTQIGTQINNYHYYYSVPTPREPIAAEPVDTTKETSAEELLGIPHKNKYTEVRKYIEERKRFDEEFKTFCVNHSLRDLCDRLTNEFGWLVDENSLQRNINRNR